MSIVLLLSMMGGWDRWGVADSYQGVHGETGGGYYLIVCFFYFYLCFYPLVSHVLCLFLRE